MKRIKILFLTAALLLPAASFAKPPKLVVNIIVGQMRYDYLRKFSDNLGQKGFRRFETEGMIFTDARYNFMQTITPATLATYTTGSYPSTHGIVSTKWIDYTSNREVSLIDDYTVRGLDSDAGIGNYSAQNIIVPTLGDRLLEETPQSKVISIALDPVSAIVLGGQHGDVYWMDDTRGNWISSSAYMNELPSWVNRYNSLRVASQYLDYNWMLMHPKDRYRNTVYHEFDFREEGRFRKLVSFGFLRKKEVSKDYPRILRTPAGNSLVTEFAKQAIIYENLGRNAEAIDMINICFDTPRYIGELYGGESMELEDMFYRLDEEIEELLRFLEAQMDINDVLIVLTSDHGASDSFDYGSRERERFNVSQFKVIVNGFMNAQYGSGDWVVDYSDRQLYINRNLVYSKGLSLEEVQNRVAAFVLQFRGVAHVLTSTALQNSSFSGSYAEKMQNSFYPKRSGDITINLMPGWIEEDEDRRASSGSMYEYDTHVPLFIKGRLFYGQKITRTIDMRDVAPTLARMMQISRPIAAEGEPIEEIARLLD